MDALDKLLGWEYWTPIVHLAAIAIFIYVIYMLITQPQTRSITNWLLLLIVLMVGVRVHQHYEAKRYKKMKMMKVKMM